MIALPTRARVTRRLASALQSLAGRLDQQRDVRASPNVAESLAPSVLESLRAPGPFDYGVEGVLRTYDEFASLYRHSITTRAWLERRLSAGRSIDEQWSVAGHCHVCERATRFGLDFKYSDGAMPNYRERLICEGCGLNSRQRFGVAFIRDVLRERRGKGRAYIYEQTTAFYTAASRDWPATLVGSEYLGLGRKSGDVVDGILHQDALALSFEDGAFDVMLANDVYEHVPDDVAAFREAARVLADDGLLFFSVPFDPNQPRTRQRARLTGDTLVHLEEPVFHGNPIDPNGSLVFFDYGWDLLDRVTSAGFKKAYCVTYYSPTCGYIGDAALLMFVAEK